MRRRQKNEDLVRIKSKMQEKNVNGSWQKCLPDSPGYPGEVLQKSGNPDISLRKRLFFIRNMFITNLVLTFIYYNIFFCSIVNLNKREQKKI